MAISNLNKYYTSQGQALPTVQARAPLYSQYGGTGAYTGTANQNSFLLGKLTSQGSTPVNATPNINSSNIGTPPYQVPPAPTIQDQTAALQAAALTNANTQATNAQTGVTSAETERTSLKNDYQILSDKVNQEGADTQKMSQELGINQLSKDYQDLNALSQSQTAKYIQGLQDIELNGGAAINVNAKQTFLNRQNAIDSMLTNSLMSAKQGSLTFAQDQVKSAMALKYDPLKAQLQTKMDFINMNFQDLSRADQKLATAKTKQWDLQMKQIDDLKELQTKIQNIAIEAAKNGASASVLSKINKAQTVSSAMSSAAGYFQDPLDVQLKKLQIQKAKMDLAPKPKGDSTKIVKINGTDYIQNADGTFSNPVLPSNPKTAAAKMAAIDKVNAITTLKDSRGLGASVGTTGFFGRGGLIRGAVGAKQEFVAGIEQLRGELTLQNLINAKANGATFGALSDAELRLLSNSASKIGTWAILNKDGQVTGYKASEKSFKAELEKIRQLAEKDAELTGGVDSYLDDVDFILQAQNNPYMEAGYITQ